MSEKTSSIPARIALYLFLGLLAYMPLHIFLSTWIGTAFGVLEPLKIAKDIVMFVGFLLAGAVSVRQPWFKELLKDKLVLLILAYGVLTALLALVKPTDPDAELLGLVYNTRFLVFFLYGLVLTRLFPVSDLLGRAIKIGLGVGAVVVLFGIMQYVLLPDDALRYFGYSRANGVLPAFFIDDKPDLERVMSTLRDPNSLGSYLIIIGMLAAGVLLQVKEQVKKRAIVGLLALTILCLWFTFSRSAWLGFALATAAFVLLADTRLKRQLLKRKKQVSLIAIALIVGLFIGLGVVKDSYFVQNVIFHADESTTLEDPNELRVRFWQESITDVIAEPEGSGPGTAGLASIRNEKQGTELNENYYLQIASEVGVLGLGLFLSILGVVACRLYRLKNSMTSLALLAAFMGLALTNFFVHIWSNEAVAYTWWGVATICLNRVRKFKNTN